MKFKRAIAAIATVLVLGGGLTLVGCTSKADVASNNLSKEADQFHVLRRIVFLNGITDKNLLVIEGYCSLGNDDKAGELSVTCKVATKGVDGAKEDAFKKHFLGLSDNVTYFVEQLTPRNVSVNHYEVTFNPETIVPDIKIQ